MDLVTRVARFPTPGETLTGLSFQTFPGGKGANQAVALARLGASVGIVGACGDDALGSQYHFLLRQLNIDLSGVVAVPGVPTGTATILVNGAGENQIIVVAGANSRVVPAFVEEHRALIETASSLLVQLEIPLESVIAGARIAKAVGARVILDPAPARELPEELYRLVDLITPNESEASILTGVDTKDEAGIRRAAEVLLACGVQQVVVKAGARGAFYAASGVFTRVPGFPVNVVDTVAAGDSFNAGIAFALGAGQPIVSAIRFANAVAGLATTKEGAQSAMPSLAEVEAFLASCPL
jgi:ribokinase